MATKSRGRPRGEVEVEGPAARLFGEQVRRFRSMREWTQAQLADALTNEGLEMSGSTVAKLERGVRPTSLDEARIISGLFGRDVASMVGEDDAKRAQRFEDLSARLKQAEADVATAEAALSSAIEACVIAEIGRNDAVNEYRRAATHLEWIRTSIDDVRP